MRFTIPVPLASSRLFCSHSDTNKRQHCPEFRKAANEVISIPIIAESPNLRWTYVIEGIKTFFKGMRRDLSRLPTYRCCVVSIPVMPSPKRNLSLSPAGVRVVPLERHCWQPPGWLLVKARLQSHHSRNSNPYLNLDPPPMSPYQHVEAL